MPVDGSIHLVLNLQWIPTPPKLVDEIPRNKLCVNLVHSYNIHSKGKESLIQKSVTAIDPVTEWFKLTQYNDKKAMKV